MHINKKKIIQSGIEQCICKIMREVKKGNQYKFITGTGFFFNCKQKKIKLFITNNHAKNEINLENRYKFTDKDLDFTVIEILDGDNISKFIEIDEFINSRDYKDEQIFTYEFP